MALFALFFIVLPIIEIYVFVLVGQAIGYLNAIGILILVSLLGVWIAKRQGIGVLARVRTTVDEGRVPGREVLDGAIVLVGGLLLIVPGFITDAVGLLLLLPPVRAFARRFLLRRMRIRVFEIGGGRNTTPGGRDNAYGGNGQRGNDPPRRERGYDGPDDIIDI